MNRTYNKYGQKNNEIDYIEKLNKGSCYLDNLTIN